MRVSKQSGIFDVNQWDRRYGNGGDDGAIITAAAAALKAQRGGGTLSLPFVGNLDTTAVVPSGIFLKGTPGETRLNVRGADVGIHHLGESLADRFLGGGTTGVALKLTQAGQGGIFLEGTRRATLNNFSVEGDLVGGIFGVKLAPRVNNNNGGSAFNQISNFVLDGINGDGTNLGAGLWCTSESGTGPIANGFCNRNFVRFGRSQTCQIGVLLEDSDTNHFQWMDTQGSTDAGYLMRGNAVGGGSSFNYIYTVQENPAAPLDFDIRINSTRNRFYGVYGIEKVSDAGANNQFDERFINHLAETHFDQEISRELIVDTPFVGSGLTRNLNLSNGSVGMFTLNNDTVFEAIGNADMLNVAALNFANPVHEFRLILTNNGGHTPSFPFVTDWAAPGGVQPAWPANATVTDFYSADGGSTWIASPVSGF